MKKTSIYILAVIIIAVMIGSVIWPAAQFVVTSLDALEHDEPAQATEIPVEMGSPVVLDFNATTATLTQPTDSITLTNGETYPVVIQKALVIVPDANFPDWSAWLYGLCTLVNVVLMCILIWKFCVFILNIINQRIFVKGNVKLLNVISLLLFAMAIMDAISGFANEYCTSVLGLDSSSYSLSADWVFPWIYLLLGCVALLFTQVWARGIEIKEDQELTI